MIRENIELLFSRLMADPGHLRAGFGTLLRPTTLKRHEAQILK